MALLDYTALDDAVIEQIKTGAPGVFRSVLSIGSLHELESKSPAANVPAAFTMISTARYSEPVGHLAYQELTQDITVIVKARNVRGDGSDRKGEQGAYELVNAVKSALIGFEPLACGPLYVAGIEPMSVARGTAIYAVTFRTTFEEEF